MTELRKYRLASTWYGPDLAVRDDWIRTFTAAEIDELARATCGTDGSEIVSLSKEAFDLPLLDPVLARVRSEILDGRGFVILRGLPVEEWCMDRVARVYWAIASRIGVPISQNSIGNKLGHVADVGGDSENSNQRAHQSKGVLPFHTDISAEIVGLLCIRQAKAGGESALASVSAIWNEMIVSHPDLAMTLTAPFHLDRRGDEVEGQDPWFTMPILVPTETAVYVCHNPRFVRSAQRFSKLPKLTKRQEGAMDMLQFLADDPRFKLKIEFQPGDIQLINNLALVHSRGAYHDWQEVNRRRHLLRLWLSVPGGKPIPDALYARHGADPKTGRPRGFHLRPDMTYTVPLQPPELLS